MPSFFTGHAMIKQAKLLSTLLPFLVLAELPRVARSQPPMEAGGFRILSKPPGVVQTQDMGAFPKGRWQGNDQLWWTGAKPGDKLRLAVPIKKEGTYDVSAVLTKARDYGIVQLFLDGQKLGKPIDLYNLEVISTEPLSLGTHKLTAGNHQLAVEIVGANPQAIKAYMFGLNCLLFKAPGTDKVAFTIPQPLYPHISLPPEAAAKAMRLPPGFSVQLGAGEPDVRQPIAMAMDDRGRLWVAEAYEYPLRAKGDKGRDRILIFEDTNGDGRLNKRTVFCEGLNLVSGLEVGFGGVWVGAAPYLLYIPIKEGEDRPAGPPKILLDGWGYHDTHETLNTFIWGPDGWLYGCHGVFTHSKVGKPGTPDDKRVPINAGIWRYHPTRHIFEVFAEGTSNPWGIDFNDQGQAFCTACVIPHLYHIIQGARYQRQAGNHFNPSTYADIQTIADHLHYVGNQWNQGDRNRSDELGGGHAHAGAMIYLGGSWPDKYRGQIFMNNIHGNRINMDWLKPRGSGWVGSHGPDFILTDDQSSQILNLRYGPDGQAWMIDWYDRNQCHHTNPAGHDKTNGRIFKIIHNGAKGVTVDLQRASDETLVDMQLRRNDWYVRHARRILQERAAAGKLEPGTRKLLAKLALKVGSERGRLRALWALHVTGGLPPEVAHQALSGAGQYERAWTVQLMTEDPNKTPPASTLGRFVEMARKDPSPVVRLYLASACQRLPLEKRWDILEGLVSHPEDALDHNLPLMYWYAMEPLAGADQRRALALGLVAGENVPLLREFMVRRIGSATTAKALDLLVEGLNEASRPEQQLAFLKGMNQALVGVRKIAPPRQWAEVHAQLKNHDHPEVRLQAQTLAVTFGDAGAVADLRDLAANAKAAASTRKRALAAILGAGIPDLAGLLQSLLSDPGLRAEALRGLAAYDDPKTPRIVLALYGSLPLGHKRDALGTLCSRAGFAEALLTAVEKKQVPAADLTADLVRQLRNLKDPKLNDRITQVWGNVRESSVDRAKLIAQTKTMLHSAPKHAPDPSLGRAVFARTCQQCHTLYGVGGKVGPDITGSNRADLDYLLSNILDPSAIIPKEYAATVVMMKNGRVITGIVRDNGKNAVTLQTANEIVVVPRAEIDDTLPSELSMMPEDLLKVLTEHEVRSLVAYLSGRQQVPMRATPDNVADFFNGKDLTGWQGDPKVWSVKDGAFVARGPTKESFLVSDMLAENVELSLEVRTSGKSQATLLIPTRQTAEGVEVALIRFGKDSANNRPNAWQRLEFQAGNPGPKVKINGKAPELEIGPGDGRQPTITLQVIAAAGEEVSFRNVRLRILPVLPATKP
jgi:putative membrane-bound dehydrogenase-like protein